MFSPFTCILCFLVGVYLWRKAQNRPETNMAISLLFMFSIGAGLDFAMSISPDRSTGLIFAQGVIFVALVCMGMIFYLSMRQLPATKVETLLRFRYASVVIVFAVATAVALTINEMGLDRWGYNVLPSLGLTLAILTYFIYVVLSIAVLAYAGLKSDDKIMKRKVMMIAIALPMPLIYGLTTILIESLSDFRFARPIMPGFTIMVLLIAYAIWRYKLFIEVPAVAETKPLTAPRPQAQTQLGRTYLVESKKVTMAYELLMDDLSKGAHGLIITREHPEMVREAWGLAATPILWLASTSGRDRIDPTNLSILQHTIVEHLRRGERPIILMDGLEYLLANNKEEKVLQMVLGLRDEIIVAQGKLIVPVDPRTMEPKTLAFFERDLEIVMHGE
ncbi:MAG: hypothetical protein A4E32_01235 [Methanomassiliicoccales archaeon PtaU1.Bin124]|nr:MAG: hypothetical protein A4E32_01235 [Methanomassiliicoccales archaeon PtaU1.Bin124]